MNLNLKHFKKTKSDDKSTTLQHKDGHTITIAHKALSPKMKEELQALGSDKPKSPKEVEKEPKTPKKDEKITKPVEKAPKKMADGGDIPYDTLIPQEQAQQQAQQQAYGVQPVPAAQQAMSQDQGIESTPVASSDAQDQSQAPDSSSPSQDDSDAQPQAAQAPQDQSPSLGGAYAQQKLGMQQAAAAQANLGDASAKIANDAAQGQQELLNLNQKHLQDTLDHQQHFLNDIANNHIDPNHYMNDRTLGQKIAMGVGLIFGGIAGGAGQQNAAMNYINAQIDRDINAQKANMDKQQNLVKLYSNMYGDQIQGANMARLSMEGIALQKMKAAAAKAQSPMAQANMNQAIGQLQAQMYPAFLQQSMLGTIKDINANAGAGKPSKIDPAQLVRYTVPAEHQAKAFSEIQAAQDTKRMSQTIMDSFEQAAKENTVLKTGAGVLRTPASVYALHQAMQPTFKDLEGTVRQAAMDNTFKNITPMPGDAEHTIATKRAALQGYLQSKASAPVNKGYNIDLRNFESTSPMVAAPQIKMYKGHAYQQVGDQMVRVQQKPSK